MSTFRTHGMNLVIEIEDQDLPTLDPVDFAFDFLLGFEVRQGGDIFELIFLRHFARIGLRQEVRG